MNEHAILTPGQTDNGSSCSSDSMRALVNAFHWDQTSLGPIAQWDSSVRAAVDLALESSAPMIILLGDEGRVIHNAGYAKLAPDRHPGLVGQPVADGWPELTQLSRDIQAASHEGRPLSLHGLQLSSSRTGERTDVWRDLETSPLRDRDGTVAGTLIIVSDITQHVRAQQLQVQEVDGFAALFEQSATFMAITSGERHSVVKANPAYLRLIASGAGRPQSFDDAHTPGLRALLDQAYKTRAAETHHALEVTVRGERPEKLFIDLTCQPILNDDGAPRGVFVQGVDISDKHRSARLLEAQHSLLEEAMRGRPLAETLARLLEVVENVLPTPVRSSVLLYNEEARTLHHGAAPNLPLEYCEAVDGCAIGPVAGSCGTAAFRREPVYVEDISRDPLWADYRLLAEPHGLRACWSTPIFGAAGELLGTFALYYSQPNLPCDKDISTIGKITRAVSLVIDRARSEERLSAALQAKEMLLHEVNHRVKNSLQLVISLLTLQANKSKSEDIRVALTEASQRLNVVTDIHARLYRTSEHHYVDFGEFIESLVKATVSSLRGQREVHLTTSINDVGKAEMDLAVPLALVINELITNAMKYAFGDASSDCRITFGMALLGGNLELVVQDNGQGLPEDFKFSASTGLGMRIVKSLTKQLGGTVTASSDNGASFELTLPWTPTA